MAPRVARKRGARGREQRDETEIFDRIERLCARLEADPAGLHQLNSPRPLVHGKMPFALEAVYQRFNGGEFFHGALCIRPLSEIGGQDGFINVGEHQGLEILVDSEGRVWRFDEDCDELVCEGSRFDRWLEGNLGAESCLTDSEGEFRDEVFAESGELLPESVILIERKRLDRDKLAIGPRWRLARALISQEKFHEARAELEEVVRLAPKFNWAWHDLARVSEKIGDLRAAADEALEATRCRSDHPYMAFFLAHAARLADALGEEEDASTLAMRARERDPDFVRRSIEGARRCISDNEPQNARELLVLAKALAPKNLDLLSLLRSLES